MYCRNCGKEVDPSAEICMSCGVRPLLEKKFCQECGVETRENQELCIKCGVRLINQKTPLFSNAPAGSLPNLFDYFKICMSKYATFEGRARRKEYWSFILFSGLTYLLSVILDMALFQSPALFYLLTIFGLFIPSLSVLVRRLHDVGKSGWFLLINLIPLIGGLWILILTVTEGQRGPNEYGADPKQ